MGIVDEIFGSFLVSDIGLPMRDLIDSKTGTPFGLHLIVGITPGSKVRYPDLVVSPLLANNSGSGVILPPPPSCTCPNSPPQSTLYVYLSLGGYLLSLYIVGTVGYSTRSKVIIK